MYCLFLYKNHQNTPWNNCKNKTYQNCSKHLKPEYNNSWFNTFERANIRNINLFKRKCSQKMKGKLNFGSNFIILLIDLSFNPLLILTATLFVINSYFS